MIRAIIGTFAVLAGFAVVENAVDASTGQAGSCKVTQAYALLRPGEQLPVRAQPMPDAPVIGALATQDMTKEVVTSVVAMTGSRSGWARIALNSRDYTAIDGEAHEYGWLPADMLAVDSRLDGAVTVYNQPGLLGSVMARIQNEDQKFRVLSCNGELLQVINARFGGVWIDRWCAKEEGCRG